MQWWVLARLALDQTGLSPAPELPHARAQAAAGGGNSYQLLQYKYVPDILEKRGPYREQHLAGANKLVSRPCTGRAAPADAAGPCAPPPRSFTAPRRPPSRPACLQAEKAQLVMAGALTDPVDGAVFIFRNLSREVGVRAGQGRTGQGRAARGQRCAGRAGQPPRCHLHSLVLVKSSSERPAHRLGEPRPQHPPPLAVLQDVEAFVKADPYVSAGLVTDWSIRPYMVVAGDSS